VRPDDAELPVVSATYTHGGVQYTEKQVAMLCALVKRPIDLDNASKRDRTTAALLASNGVAVNDGESVEITDKGRAAIAAINARVNGKSEPATKRTYKPRAAKPAIPAKSNGHGSLDLAAIRAQIVARYEADLAAVDRLSEIASALK